MSSAGVVGLGVMGAAVGRRLSHVLDGPVLGVEPQAARCQAWESMTRRKAVGSVSEAGHLDAWFVAVRSGSQVQAVVSSILELGGRSVIYVLTTLSKSEAEALGKGGERPLAWPVGVSGGETAALRGRLVAAVPDLLPDEAAIFLKATVASYLVPVGGLAQVAVAKALVNCMIAYQFRALERLVAVGGELDVAPRAILELIQLGSAGSGALRAVFEYDADLAGSHDSALAGLLGAVPPSGVGPALDSVRRRARAQW